VVQDSRSGHVLMLGYMNRDALDATLNTRQVTFWSRSRNTLWRKGETSGHVLALVSLHADCDGDTLLVRAVPAGPTCHTGSRTCFADDPGPALAFLAALDATIEQRRGADPATSYTARLLREGVARAAQKVGEEGVETALAGAGQDDAALTAEAADLLYHLMVLLRARHLSLAHVARELAGRHGSRPA
ncbi:MAG: bifunctional phosphoribosyl-AMP cyclohydrolase/phosphoribosyl-ATP diphosphatase HisIE, partial [Alphaproteobacteria bacterium]